MPQEHLSFMVQGSAMDPYQVDFYKDGNNLTAYCTCKAGQKRQYCKHRFNILHGLTKGIVSDNLADVQTVKGWLPGSDLERAMQEYECVEAECNKEIAKLRKKISAAKKEVAKIMHN